jgi:Ran GTPase-activating protein (RanGAP) involved in mRNA processing and transport
VGGPAPQLDVVDAPLWDLVKLEAPSARWGDGNPIGAEGAAAICGVISSKLGELRNLNLGNCELGGSGVASVAGAIVACPHFCGVDLTRNDFGDEGALALGETLCKCAELQQLWLSNNGIGHQGMACLSRHGLPPRLQVLDFSNASLGSHAAGILASAMHSALREVYLFDVCLGDLQLATFCEGLQRCEQLHHLDLSENEISDDGIGCLSSVIAKSLPCLKVLDLCENNICYVGARNLLDLVLPACPKLQHIDLKWNNLGTNLTDLQLIDLAQYGPVMTYVNPQKQLD